MVRADMKTRLREEFMQMVVHRLDPTATSRYFPRCDEDCETELDFHDIFCQVLHQNGAKAPDFDIELFDFLIWDETDKGKSEYMKFMSSMLSAFNRKKVVYMRFLEFVVKRNHTLARMVFRDTAFNVAYCLIYGNFSMEDFKQIAAWDLEIGSDIFRNNAVPVLLYACDSALISNDAFAKMKQLILTHGPDIMLWTSSGNDRTNVNIFLQRGYIMNTEYCYRMEQKLPFMINCCPAALKKHVIRNHQKENAFTIILSRCFDVGIERHHTIVHNVFQHIEMHDLYEMYNDCETLLELVRVSGNAVVKHYLEQKFGSRIFATLL